MDNIKKNLCVAGMAVLLPYLITLLYVDGNRKMTPDYTFVKSGKTIVMDNLEMDMEEFIPLVLMNRMSIDEEEEVLKAQAVIIRTHIASKFEHAGADIIQAEKLNVHYATYAKLEDLWGKDFTDNYNYLKKIISNTSMQIITCDNEIITPYFHEASYGRTRSGRYKYLNSVDSGNDSSAKNYLTIKYIEKNKFVQTLKNCDSKISIDDIKIITDADSEYVQSVKYGKESISGSDFVKLFELKSPCFTIEDYEGQVRIITRGIGHGYGLSMYGARNLAGEGSSYETILKHYYSKTDISKYS